MYERNKDEKININIDQRKFAYYCSIIGQYCRVMSLTIMPLNTGRVELIFYGNLDVSRGAKDQSYPCQF